MADSIATLQAKIVALITQMINDPYKDPAGRAVAIEKYALDLATAIDEHIKSHVTSVEGEGLV